MDAAAVEAHAAWRAAREKARALSNPTPAFAMDPDRAAYFKELDRLRQEGYAADRAASEAFRVFANALPEVNKPIFISPRDWLAKQDVWKTEYAPVKQWIETEYWTGWYPCLGHFEIDTSTGERFLRAAHMMDDCVETAASHNEALADYAEAKRTGDFRAYYQKHPPARVP